jgi:hypothetical protein
MAPSETDGALKASNKNNSLLALSALPLNLEAMSISNTSAKTACGHYEVKMMNSNA